MYCYEQIKTERQEFYQAIEAFCAREFLCSRLVIEKAVELGVPPALSKRLIRKAMEQAGYAHMASQRRDGRWKLRGGKLVVIYRHPSSTRKLDRPLLRRLEVEGKV